MKKVMNLFGLISLISFGFLSLVAMPPAPPMPPMTMDVPPAPQATPKPSDSSLVNTQAPSSSVSQTVAPLPVSTPVPQSSTPPPPPSGALTPPAVDFTKSPSSVQSAASSSDIEKLNANLNEVSKIKAALKDSLKELNDKVQQAYSDMASAKKLSFETLNKASQAEAKANFDKINEILQKLKTLQQDISQQQVQKFDESAKKIQTLMDDSNTLIKAIKDKRSMSSTTSNTPATTGNIAPVVSASTSKAAEVPVAKQPTKEPSMIHVVFERMGDFFEGVAILAGKGFDMMKKWIYPDSKAPAVNEELKKKVDSTVKTSQPEPLGGAQAMASKPAAPVTQESPSTQPNTQIDEMVGILKKMDEKVSELSNKTKQVDQRAADVFSGIKNDPNLSAKLNLKLLEDTSITPAGEPAWKTYSKIVFGYFLDVLGVLASYTKIIITKSYSFIMDKVISPFMKDVKEKAKTEQPATGQVAK